MFAADRAELEAAVAEGDPQVLRRKFAAWEYCRDEVVEAAERIAGKPKALLFSGLGVGQ